jgi:hypothetical protein
MKKIYNSIFLLSCFVAYSQTDTIPLEKKMPEKKYCFSVFGGLGIGGSDLDNYGLKGGLAKGVSTRFHYGTHTINAYATEVNAPSNSSLTLNQRNCGLTYGIGTYGKHFSAGCLVGVAYTNITAISQNVTVDDPLIRIPVSYRTENYNVVNACLGLHASLKTKYIGIGYQVYYNLFGSVSSFNALLGIELTLK